MKYLFDTSTIKHELKCCEQVEKISKYCSDIKSPFCVSDYILKELEPGVNVEFATEDEEISAKALYMQTNRLANTGEINLIRVADSQRISDIYKSMRKKYYGWMYDVDYLKNKGFSDDEIKRKAFRYKDIGECSLIAIALTDTSSHVIISEDKGTIYKHPDVNIFEKYADKGIQVVKYYESNLYHEYNCNKS